MMEERPQAGRRHIPGPSRFSGSRLPWLLALLALATAACTCTGLLDPVDLVRGMAPEEAGEVMGTLQAAGPTATPRPEGGEALPSLLAQGAINVPSIRSTTAVELQGKILTVQMTNPGSGEVVVDIPCGLVFEPASNPSDQRMMAIQPASVAVPAGGDADLAPYVICLDPQGDLPSLESTYSIGEIASGQLGQLGACLCEKPLGEGAMLEEGLQAVGMQLAVWSIASGQPPAAIMEGELPKGDSFEQFLPQEGAELFGGLQGMMVQPAVDLLEECGLSVPSE